MTKREYMTKQDIQDYLHEHICRGDKGDGIPNIRSDDDTFINPDKRQPPVNAKKVALWKDKKTLSEGERINFSRNERLVDFSFIPDDIQKDVLEAYQTRKEKTAGNLNAYFMKHRLVELYKYIRQF